MEFSGGRPGFLDFLWDLVGGGLDFWIFYGIYWGEAWISGFSMEFSGGGLIFCRI